MASSLTADEVIAILESVDSGADRIVDTPGGTWDEVYAGNVVFVTEAGHAVTVFNDCDCWGYLDHLKTADGREWAFDDWVTRDHDAHMRVERWEPEHPERWGWL